MAVGFRAWGLGETRPWECLEMLASLSLGVQRVCLGLRGSGLGGFRVEGRDSGLGV